MNRDSRHAGDVDTITRYRIVVTAPACARAGNVPTGDRCAAAASWREPLYVAERGILKRSVCCENVVIVIERNVRNIQSKVLIRPNRSLAAPAPAFLRVNALGRLPEVTRDRSDEQEPAVV